MNYSTLYIAMHKKSSISFKIMKIPNFELTVCDILIASKASVQTDINWLYTFNKVNMGIL